MTRSRTTASMVSNAEIEMRWVDAWNELLAIVADRSDVRCLLPDGQIVNVEICKGWLQDSVYKGFSVEVKPDWVLGQHGIVASRFSPA